ncbi:hypothetical protein [Solibacillus isronensis]|uniref:hypothetical protein n=1 Tax=Solibacillus isronensis TaxID=412383 RepID=UPI002041C63F|nr:hypothetical protein [Solibacillus isronensis]MCM3723692.1 hypothetical protein [Solibacillus isronensis]
MSNRSIANLSFILCAVILLNNLSVLVLHTEISKMTFKLSLLLLVMLFINGIVHKKKASK